jgi:hypothetical protein
VPDWRSAMRIVRLATFSCSGAERPIVRSRSIRIAISFAIRSGRDPTRPVVLLGSHLDTQPHGDGSMACMASWLDWRLRAMNDAGIETEAPMVVVSWTNVVRFASGLTGSSAFAGLVSHAGARDTVSHDGWRLSDELSRIGFDGDMPPTETCHATVYASRPIPNPSLWPRTSYSRPWQCRF